MPLNEIKVPGKVILSGEYAVMYGGTAVVAPCERYVTVSETASQNGDHTTPIISAALEYPLTEAGEFESRMGKPGIILNSSDFFMHMNGTKRKLGIGLSAAEAVAVVELRLKRAGLNGAGLSRKTAEYAHVIHHRTQGGIGSGADIFCCALRRPIIYRNENGVPRVINDKKNNSIKIPVRMIWSGIVSHTREMIHKYNQWMETGGTKAEEYSRKAAEVGERLAPLWFTEDFTHFYEVFDEYIAIMKVCASLAGLDYWLDCHTELDNWARKYGGRAKPSGAGGGDMIILIGDLPVEELHRDIFRIKCQV